MAQYLAHLPGVHIAPEYLSDEQLTRALRSLKDHDGALYSQAHRYIEVDSHVASELEADERAVQAVIVALVSVQRARTNERNESAEVRDAEEAAAAG